MSESDWIEAGRDRHCVDCGTMLLWCEQDADPILVCPHCDQIGECGPIPWPVETQTSEQFWRETQPTRDRSERFNKELRERLWGDSEGK